MVEGHPRMVTTSPHRPPNITARTERSGLAARAPPPPSVVPLPVPGRNYAEYFRCPASTVIRFTPASAVPGWRTLAKNRHSLVAAAGVSSTAI